MTDSPLHEPTELTQVTQDLTSPEQAYQGPPSGGQTLAPVHRAYVMEKCLGQGGLGQVWRATRQDTGHKVALRLLSASSGLQELLKPILAMDTHPNLALITDVELEHSPPLLVMPLYQGSLGGLARQEGHENLEGLVRSWMVEAATALEFLHSRGMCHGRLSPENILLDREGSIRLADFGLLALAEPSSYYFLAPEQEGSATIAADLYGLGATFYYILSGEYPRGSPVGLRQLRDQADPIVRRKQYRHQLKVVPLKPLAQLNPRVDPRLAQTIETCLSLEPRRRFARAAEVAQRLSQAQRKLEATSLVVRWSIDRIKRLVWAGSVMGEVLLGWAWVLNLLLDGTMTQFWGGLLLAGGLWIWLLSMVLHREDPA